MSENVGFAGFSIKLNEEDQSEKKLKEITKKLGFSWNEEEDYGFEELMWNLKDYKNRWKPHYDYDGKYGFVYVTHYEYEAFDIEFYAKITDMGRVLKEFVEKTQILPKEEIKAFAIIYYNGSDNPFRF